MFFKPLTLYKWNDTTYVSKKCKKIGKSQDEMWASWLNERSMKM